MTSELIEETDEYLDLVEWIHHENDELAEWMVDKDGKYLYPENIIAAADNALYEFEVNFRVNKKTGEVTILSFR